MPVKERIRHAPTAAAIELTQLPCTELHGVGPQLASCLQRLGIVTVQDLLFHLPLHYQDRTRVTPINRLRAGQYAVVEGQIASAQLRYHPRRSLLCTIRDGSAALIVRFFYFNATQQRQLAQTGTLIRCCGEVRHSAVGLEMIHPEYRLLHDATPAPRESSLTPIYPTTEGLQQLGLRKLTDQALALLERGGLPEYLPAELLQHLALPDVATAVRYLHRPPPNASLALLATGRHPAQQRLAFEELLAHQLSMRSMRLNWQRRCAPKLQPATTLLEQFYACLSFPLTAAQQRVIAEIQQDLQCDQPMLRLVQGDVGSGKTVVAAAAMLHAVASGYQAALMAPTELLAEQHYKNFHSWCTRLGVELAYLSGSAKGSTRKAMVAAIRTGVARIVIGTHALFQKDVDFERLGLVVIDEQHRFGVGQRLALTEKGAVAVQHPHQLIMTATPIPRTLAMTAYADLDYSVIDELPPGRKPVATVLISNQRRDEVITRIDQACRSGRQAYWVCTLIEESEALQCQAAEATAAALTQSLSQLRLGLVHGRLTSAEKQAVMTAFRAGELDVLVATTVIEVGVDVPNATLMVIENPERLGLAQLHQLRGRIGRGGEASHCVLLYQSPLTQTARARLTVLRDSHDGFVIAQRDLELRGPGEVLGTRQAGLMQLRIANILRDQQLLPRVQAASQLLLQQHPQQAQHLIARWVIHGGKYSRA